MTERELFYECIPQIAELVVECRKLTTEKYENFKKGILGQASEEVRPFMKKVFIVVDSQLHREVLVR